MINQKNKPTYIDLFAGAGGLSEGFIKAGYEPVAHVEMDENSCFTLKTRLAYHYLKNVEKFNLYVSYLRREITRNELYENIPEELLNSVINEEINPATIKSIFQRVDKSLANKNLDIIIGGPPCQAYSISGRSAKTKNGKMKENPRNFLFKQYGEFLKKYKPKLFLFENVPGLHSANEGKYYKNMKNYFNEIGYNVEDSILNAADFGVLQRRKRIIIIGWKKDLDFKYPDFEKDEHNWTIKDLFCDLPELKPGDSPVIANYKKIINDYLMDYEIRNGMDFLTLHITRPHNKKDLKIYELAIDKLENFGKRINYNEIPEKIRTQKNTTAFLDRFKVVDKESISHTMIAHIAKDGHHFIHPDKEQLRSLSVREAARIQSFPDDYFFEGTRTSMFTQIGNAVPVYMSYKIAVKIRGFYAFKNN